MNNFKNEMLFYIEINLIFITKIIDNTCPIQINGLLSIFLYIKVS